MTDTVVATHIVKTPGTCGGKPRIAGHRITVQHVAAQSALGLSPHELAEQWDVSLAEIFAALAYYYDHREEVDAALRTDEEFAEEMKRQNPSLLAEKIRECFKENAMTPQETCLKKMQQYVANIAISASTLRSLGGGGFVVEARRVLADLDLGQLANLDPSAYPEWLETQTQALAARFPKPDLWGPARKSINIFMGMAHLNRFLCSAYGLERFAHALEVPLDSIVAGKLRVFAERQGVGSGDLPKWKTIKGLHAPESQKYQMVAEEMAKKRGIPRGQLDMELWEPNDTKDARRNTITVPA